MEQYANWFLTAMNQAINQVFPVFLPKYVYPVKSSVELTYVFYYYPDVAMNIPEYKNVIAKTYELLSVNNYPVYAIAESMPGRILLDMQVNDLSGLSEKDIENSFNNLKNVLPQAWSNNINADIERRYFVARALLGLYTGLSIRKRLISDIKLSGIDAREELVKLANNNIITFYPFIYEDEALADVILSYYSLIPDEIKQMLYIPGYSKTVQKQLTEISLTKQTTPSSFTRPMIKYTQQSLDRTLQFMYSLDESELKKMGNSIGIHHADKTQLINAIIEKIAIMPYSVIPGKLKEVYDLLVDDNTVTDYLNQAESLTTPELRELTHMNATRQTMVQTLVHELLQPWYAIITTHPQYVIEQLQIVVPQGMDPVKYLQDNLASYKNLIEKRYQVMPLTELAKIQDPAEYLTHLTDLELFTMFGIQVPYRSRDELITNLLNSLYHPMFLIPLDMSKCINKDVANPEIAYGTALGYICMTKEQARRRPLVIAGYQIPNVETSLL